MVYTIADAKRRFSELMKRAAYKGETVTIGTRGKAEAALISVEELQRLRDLELEREARLLERAVRASKGTAGMNQVLAAWQDAHAPARRSRRRRGAER